MRSLPRILLIAACASALGLCGCLGQDEASRRAEGDTLVIYSSLPASGTSAPAARAVAAGERLALEEAGGRVRGRRVRLVQLDAARAGEGPWSPERVNANAERAADDPKAIAYLGELAYGASAVSVPITNDASLLQVSPMDSLTSLTQSRSGARGPGRSATTQPASAASRVSCPTTTSWPRSCSSCRREGGAQRMGVLFDSDIYSRELAGQLLALGRRDGPRPVGSEEYRGALEEIPDLVRRLAEARPDVVVYAGIAGRGTGRLLAQIDQALPRIPVYAGSGLLDALRPTGPGRPAYRVGPAAHAVDRLAPGARAAPREAPARSATPRPSGPRRCTGTRPCASCSPPSAPAPPTASSYGAPA